MAEEGAAERKLESHTLGASLSPAEETAALRDTRGRRTFPRARGHCPAAPTDGVTASFPKGVRFLRRQHRTSRYRVSTSVFAGVPVTSSFSRLLPMKENTPWGEVPVTYHGRNFSKHAHDQIAPICKQIQHITKVLLGAGALRPDPFSFPSVPGLENKYYMAAPFFVHPNSSLFKKFVCSTLIFYQTVAAGCVLSTVTNTSFSGLRVSQDAGLYVLEPG